MFSQKFLWPRPLRAKVSECYYPIGDNLETSQSREGSQWLSMQRYSLLILHLFLTAEVPTVLPLTTCGPTEATCSNGECIDKSRVCDGRYDCSDRSDEIRCTKPSKLITI